MKSIIDLLNSDYLITSILIKNFTVLDETITIEIEIVYGEYRIKTVVFTDVSGINIDRDYYTSSQKSSIVIDDISASQMEGVKFKISVSEDCMTFYCQNVFMKDNG